MAPRSMVRSDWDGSAAPRASVSGIFGRLPAGFEIVELGVGAVEHQLDGTDRSVALLADDDLGDVVNVGTVLLPFGIAVVEALIAFVGAFLRLSALVVVLLAIDEHHHVGILLDRPGLA